MAASDAPASRTLNPSATNANAASTHAAMATLRTRPVADRMRPLPTEASVMPAISGIRCQPDSAGDKPRAVWKYCGMNTTTANSVNPVHALRAETAEKLRCANSDSGSNGLRVRACTHTNRPHRPRPSSAKRVADQADDAAPAETDVGTSGWRVLSSRLTSAPHNSAAPR